MNNFEKLKEVFFKMLDFQTGRSKKAKEVRNAYILGTVAVLVFFPATYLWIREYMPGTGQGGN